MQTTFFLGTSTPEGFRACPEQLFRPGLQLTVIKGGSGCGKSTFMKALAAEGERRGMDVVRLLCSSDPDSLDGVILDNAVAYVDGTAPHVLEPTLCGGRMNYLNFGEFYDRKALCRAEEEILAVQKQNAACYPKATAYLKAAAALQQLPELPTDELESIAECLALSSLRPGEEAEALPGLICGLTPKGAICLAQTPETLCRRVIVLRDSYGLSAPVLRLLQRRAAELGQRCVVCCDPMAPEGAPQALLLPAAGVAFVRSGGTFIYEGREDCRIDLNALLTPAQRRELTFAQETSAALLEQAIGQLRRAKALHDKLERLCRPHVDFGAVTALTERTILAIFGKKVPSGA